MSEEEKLAVLQKIAHAFNQAGITWALGASALLYLWRIAPTFHDLDLFVSEDDGLKAQAILTKLGTRQPDHYDPSRYGTKIFNEFVVDGVDVDFMVGFSIIVDGKEIPCILTKETIAGTLDLSGEKIPYESLEEWKKRYALMGRKEKVAMLEKALAVSRGQ